MGILSIQRLELYYIKNMILINLYFLEVYYIIFTLTGKMTISRGTLIFVAKFVFVLVIRVMFDHH